MKSYTTLLNLFTTFTQNTSTANSTLGAQLLNDAHRYLLQKYFNNETNYQIPSFGSVAYALTTTAAISAGATTATLNTPFTGATGTYTATFSDGETSNATLTNNSTALSWTTATTAAVTTAVNLNYVLTGSLNAGATSATLGAAWGGNTTMIQVTFSTGEIYWVNFTKGSTAITWQAPLLNTATSAITIGGQQFYSTPPNYSKMKTVTLTTGNLQWTLSEINTRQEWDRLNVFPYYANIPQYYFIYPGGDHGAQVGIWPIPSTTGLQITYNYKYRIPDLSIADVTGSGNSGSGNITLAKGATALTGSGTSWAVTTNQQNEARWIQVPQTTGDGNWYQLVNISSTTAATLYQPYQGTSLSGATSFTIGQMPLLNEDFHDLIVYWALVRYFSSINPDQLKANQFKALYEEGLHLLAEYSGSNTIDVNLSHRPMQQNPNLFSMNMGGAPN